jgi:uncharacterized protein (TIGR03435 family)
MTSFLARFVVSSGESIEASIILKATFILGLTLVTARLAPRARASVRHLVFAAGFCVLLTLPIAAVLLPPVSVPIQPSNVSDSVAPLQIVESSSAVEHVAGFNGPSLAPRNLRPSVSASTVFRAGWILGAVLFLIPNIVSLSRIWHIHRSGVVWSNREPLVRSLALQAGVRRRVDVRVHADIVAPMACGFLRPAIVLPSDAVEWPDAEIRRAVVHELEHVRRADWPTRLMARTVCALYWFHPFVWMAWRRLCLESELACDDAVLCGSERTDYADQLVNLARRLVKGATPSALPMASRSDLSARVSAVLDVSQARGRVGLLGSATIGIVAVTLLLVVSPLRAISRASNGLDGLMDPSTVLGVNVPLLQTQTPTATRQTPNQTLQTPRSAGAVHPTSTLNARQQAAEVTSSSFDVASVRLNTSGRVGVHKGPVLSGDELTAVNVQVRWLILEAYGIGQYQLLGGPSWISTDYFDVTMKAHAAASKDQLRSMLRTLLADRFHLVVHIETRDTPVYALVLAESDDTLGPNLHRGTADCAALRAVAGEAQARTTNPCGFNLQVGRRAGRGLGMDTLAGWLSRDAGRMVVDKTGLDGVFDFDITYTPNELRHHLPDRFPTVDPDGPSIFAAVQEQLGLKLEPQERLGDVLVIDHVEQPRPD